MSGVAEIMKVNVMRKFLTIVLITGLLFGTLPTPAMAGDTHAVRNRWAGAGIGVAAVTLGGLLLGSLFQPAAVVAAPPTVVAPPPIVYYTPPPVVYAPPPVVVAPPPVVYAPAPVVVYGGWGPPGHWKKWHRGHERHRW
jgi:hypothetical protein